MGSRIGAITFGGLSSGLPTDQIISKLMDLSRQPIQAMQKQSDDTSTKLDLYRDLNSKTSALRDALRGLDNMADVIRKTNDAPVPSAFEEFRQYAASSSDESKATVSISRSATPGTLSFSIERLAQQHRSISGTSASADTVIAAGGGSLSIQVGGGSATNIAIAAGATVQNVVDAVNAAGIDASAFVVNDGQGAVRIAIVGDKPGADHDLTISNDFGQTFTVTQAAQNARIVLDPDSSLPVAIESSTNTFQNVIQGLSLAAKATTATGERVTVTIDTSGDAVEKSLSKLVDAYNAVVDVIHKQSEVDPTTNRGGPLLGDPTMVNLAQRMAGAIARTYGSGSITSTAQLGIHLTGDGHLSLDEAKLGSLLDSNFEDVAKFVAGSGGFADQFRQVLDGFVDPKDGVLTSTINGASSRISDLKDSIDQANARLDDYEANLVQQFATLEDTLSQFQQQAGFLTSYLNSQSR
jgi:flagellar hook-associated protein 2